MTVQRPLLLVAALIALLSLGATLSILVVKFQEQDTMAGQGLVVMTTGVGGRFNLVDHRGRPVTEASFAGRPALVYFGYSFCPDICPTTLQTMAAALASKAAVEKHVAGLFVTVDPGRDTVSHLAEYVPLFHADLTGLTGAPDNIGAMARGFRVYYRLRKEVDPVNYPVDHSSYVYLMDEQWRLLAVFAHDATPLDIEAALLRLS